MSLIIFAVGFSGMILWWIRSLNEFEVQGMSYLNPLRFHPLNHFQATGTLLTTMDVLY